MTQRWEIEKIINHQCIKSTQNKKFYKYEVKWISSSLTSWKTGEQLINEKCEWSINNYWDTKFQYVLFFKLFILFIYILQ